MEAQVVAGKIIIYIFQWNFINSNMYVLKDKDSMLIIDPIYTEEAVAFFKSVNVHNAIIILTHEHFDHINGVNWLREHFLCVVYSNKVCAEHICSATKNLSAHSEAIAMFNKSVCRTVTVPPFTCSSDIVFDSVMNISWQGYEVKMITTPGHTDGSICVLLSDKYLFTGDTLLDVPTITRLPGGSRERFHKVTLPYLKSLLKKQCIVLPGHGKVNRLQNLLDQYFTEGEA